MGWTYRLTCLIFALTYAGLALGRAPGLRMDRAGIAFVGAALMLVAGSLTLEQAVSPESIDFKTLVVLFGMMIVVGGLRVSGCFERLADAALRRIATPRGLLAATIGLSGVLSAFLINDVVCVALTPLALHLARRLKFDPLPHLLGLATAANIGSVGAITGNPQNIYIGAHSGISYFRFSARLMPVAMLGLVAAYLVVSWAHRARLSPLAQETPEQGSPPTPSDRGVGRPPRRAVARLQIKTTIIALASVVMFFAGAPLELVALGAAALVLLERVNPQRIYANIDWGLLMMFTGLFIVVHAFEIQVVADWHMDRWTWLARHPIDSLSLVSAALSNLVSNVPAVLLLEPAAQAVPAGARESAWLALAMSSTLAGNLTLLGSVANLIVVESARREGVAVSFWSYCRVGVPLTLVTLALGVAWLQWVPY